MDKAVLCRWLEAGYVDEGTLFETRAGTPQGGIISPVIANMALDGLEAAVHASAGGSERARRRAKLNVIRYADDFVVSGASKDVLESQVLPAIRRFMEARGLELSEEKTRITHIEQGFDFLGQNVRKYGRQCLTKPAKKSINSLLDKVREIIKGNATATQAAVIRLSTRSSVVGPCTTATSQRKQPLIESMIPSGTHSGGGQSAGIPPKVHGGSRSGTSGRPETGTETSPQKARPTARLSAFGCFVR